ncbi:ATP-dependent DNA ligase [Paractinoplanes atraurantiacus]|uniref:DNA ligase (ATP) n=1 Tax=Paractinoplanes atraurantiacus TaxID=1036182 RepID=A0A285JR85_9ACTN|nr:hypothetical protein [Actinoplanes atraurantiacus]SNY62820.1 ATP dependent DNA ligase domain-containing protein [Actinoplanes atraurantiacus]
MKIDGALVRPMLAALGRLPTGAGWAFEFKYDGVRAVTYAEEGEVRALTRNDNDVTSTYPELAEVATLLRYAGQVGTGFTDAMLHHLQASLDAARRTTAPVPGVPRDHARHARWVEPTLVGEVAFRNWTVDGRLRHASWRGLRPDRDLSSLVPPPPARSSPALVPEEVTGTVMTKDAAWRVEAVRRDGREWYRIVHGDNVVDSLALDDVRLVLEKAGIDLADLTEAA